MIPDYTSYGLMKLKELSVDPSDNYAFTKATVHPPDAVNVPEISDENNASVDSVAVFELTWSQLLLQNIQQPLPQSERGSVTVLFARHYVQSEDGGDSELLARCNCH